MGFDTDLIEQQQSAWSDTDKLQNELYYGDLLSPAESPTANTSNGFDGFMASLGRGLEAGIPRWIDAHFMTQRMANTLPSVQAPNAVRINPGAPSAALTLSPQLLLIGLGLALLLIFK